MRAKVDGPPSAASRLGRLRLRCIQSMPAGGAEPERLQKFLRDLRRVNPREPEGRHASRVESREQLLQTGATVLDERAERDNLRPLPPFT